MIKLKINYQKILNYIDKNLKRLSHDRTIGIIICKKDNKYLIEYCSNKRIISREYMLVKYYWTRNSLYIDPPRVYNIFGDLNERRV